MIDLDRLLLSTGFCGSGMRAYVCTHGGVLSLRVDVRVEVAKVAWFCALLLLYLAMAMA